MTVRPLLAGLIALLVAVPVARNAAVEALAVSRPAEATKVWRTHPDAELSAGMTAIATATRERRVADPAVFGQIVDASRKEPLAPEPFLVTGVNAQLAGNDRLAEQAFLAAKWRDGRSLPARYFLADLYFRRGDAARGLREIGALAGLAPNGTMNLAPYVAIYAKNRSTWPQLRKLFIGEPRLEQETLVAMTADASNADAILALATRERIGPSSAWLAPLVETLVKANQFARARAVWAAVSHIRLDSEALVYDPDFARSGAPPPFNWSLTSSTVGLAERRSGGGLHVIFYGQEDGVLASQILILTPGRYRLISRGRGAPANAKALHWTLTCAGSKEPFASIPLSEALATAWTFTVPAGCPGQRLELAGSSPDLPSQSEATIRSIVLAPERPNA